MFCICFCSEFCQSAYCTEIFEPLFFIHDVILCCGEANCEERSKNSDSSIMAGYTFRPIVSAGGLLKSISSFETTMNKMPKTFYSLVSSGYMSVLNPLLKVFRFNLSFLSLRSIFTLLFLVSKQKQNVSVQTEIQAIV